MIVDKPSLDNKQNARGPKGPMIMDDGRRSGRALTCRILKNDTNELIYKTEIDSQT